MDNAAIRAASDLLVRRLELTLRRQRESVAATEAQLNLAYRQRDLFESGKPAK